MDQAKQNIQVADVLNQIVVKYGHLAEET